MNISSTSQSYGVMFDAHGAATQKHNSVGAASSDTVSISQEARLLMEQSKNASNIETNQTASTGQSAEAVSASSAVTPENSVEMWQVPSWYAETMPIYKAEVGGQSSITVQGVAYEQSAAWDSYIASVEKHYKDTLVDHNIGDSVEERYNALIVDKAQSLNVKNDFYSRIAADEELQGLMNSLGVKLPS